MRFNSRVYTGLTALVALLTLSLDPRPLRADESPASSEVGVFPSPRLVELFAARLADDLLSTLEPSDAQRQAARVAAQSRARRWFEQRRQPLVAALNRYIEFTLETEPPTAATIGEWSRDALPLLDEAQDVFSDFARELRLGLNVEQANRWDADLAALRVAFSFARSKLTIWRDGGFDPAVDWPGGDGFPQLAASEQSLLAEAQQKARDALRPSPIDSAPVVDAPQTPTTAAAHEPPATPADSPRFAREAIPPADRAEIPLVKISPPPQLLPVPKYAQGATPTPAASSAPGSGAPRAPTSQPVQDEWHDLVRDFCRRYALDADQDHRAMVYLREAQRRRDRYQESRLADFRRVEQELRAPGAKDLAELQREYERLRSPIDAARRELLDRLNTIPSEQQRRAISEKTGAAPTSQPGVAEPRE